MVGGWVAKGEGEEQVREAEGEGPSGQLGSMGAWQRLGHDPRGRRWATPLVCPDSLVPAALSG